MQKRFPIFNIEKLENWKTEKFESWKLKPLWVLIVSDPTFQLSTFQLVQPFQLFNFPIFSIQYEINISIFWTLKSWTVEKLKVDKFNMLKSWNVEILQMLKSLKVQMLDFEWWQLWRVAKSSNRKIEQVKSWNVDKLKSWNAEKMKHETLRSW